MKKITVALIIVSLLLSMTVPAMASGNYVWPLIGHTTITSNFGYRNDPFTGEWKGHSGTDIGAPYGTPVYASSSGTLTIGYNGCTHNYAGQCGCGYTYGNFVYIDDDYGMRVYYAHLTSITASAGRVEQGQQIGTVGSTGNSTGAHLHFEMRTGTSSSTRVNPLNYVSSSNQIGSVSPTFDFWDIGDNITISGTYKFWWKQTGYGNCDVNVDINGTHLKTLYQDSNGYFSYEFDSTKYANGTYTLGAIIRSTSGAEKYVTRTININNTANNPTSAVDICEGVDGGLHIRGWAFDKDNTNETIQVHVYIGGPAGSGEGHVIYANTYRSDVNDVYGVGSNHGFDAIISTSLRGKQNVYIYIINIGAGQNVLHTRENINIPDLHAPTIENITVTNRSSSGYTVTCTFKDDVGLSYVTFPTWTPNNGQDDITWDRVELSGKEQTVSYTVKIDKHNNEEAVYYTDIYVYDTSNNSKWGHSSCYVESNPPVISDVKITDISSKGYTVTCSVNDAENEISKVLFPTWSDYNGQDDLAYDWPNNPSVVGTVKDDIATFRVNTSEHNNEIGMYYYTHIYAYDSCGNVTAVHTSTQVGDPYIEFSVKKDDKKDIFTISCHCMETGNTVILALYKENRFVKMYNSIYEGDAIPFTVTEDYDNYKVMVWENLETLSPVCEANSTPTIIE